MIVLAPLVGMENDRPCVIIESPFKGDIFTNVAYGDCLMIDSIARGEAPFLGHLLYPRVLNDEIAIDRVSGMACHMAWLSRAQYIVVGMDLGEPTDGMRNAIDLGDRLKIDVKPRWLGKDWRQRLRTRRTAGFV